MGTVFKLAAFASAILCSVPAYKQIETYIWLSQRDPDYFHGANVAMDQVRAVFILLIGLTVAYLLFRAGSYFQSRHGSRRGQNNLF